MNHKVLPSHLAAKLAKKRFITDKAVIHKVNRQKQRHAPCSSPPRHLKIGCWALCGFCSCFAAKALAHSSCSRCCRPPSQLLNIPKKYPMSHTSSSSYTSRLKNPRRPRVCLLLETATAAANSQCSAYQLLPSHTCYRCSTEEDSLGLRLAGHNTPLQNKTPSLTLASQ